MKKLLIVTSEYPPIKAGISNLTFSVYTEFRKQGEDVYLFAPIGSDVPEPERQFPTFRRPTGHTFQWPIHIANSWRLKKIIRQHSIDQVLFMDASARCFPFPWIPKVSCAIYVNGTELLRSPLLPECASGRFFLLSAAYRKAQKVLCISEATRDLFRKTIPGKPATVLYPCFDEKRVFSASGSAIASPYPPAENVLTFLTVSRLAARKGHDLVLEALARLREELPPFRYFIAGQGPEGPRLKALAETLNLADRVVFLGAIPDEILGAYYHYADIFIMLSQTNRDGTEGFGLTFVEANASGTVTIGSNRGGVVEAVEPGVSGILVQTDSMESASAAILAFARDNKGRSNMESTARDWARGNFSATRMYERWLEIMGDPKDSRRREPQ